MIEDMLNEKRSKLYEQEYGIHVRYAEEALKIFVDVLSLPEYTKLYFNKEGNQTGGLFRPDGRIIFSLHGNRRFDDFTFYVADNAFQCFYTDKEVQKAEPCRTEISLSGFNTRNLSDKDSTDEVAQVILMGKIVDALSDSEKEQELFSRLFELYRDWIGESSVIKKQIQEIDTELHKMQEGNRLISIASAKSELTRNKGRIMHIDNTSLVFYVKSTKKTVAIKDFQVLSVSDKKIKVSTDKGINLYDLDTFLNAFANLRRNNTQMEWDNNHTSEPALQTA